MPFSMLSEDPDTALRRAAFEHLRALGQNRDYLTSKELADGFQFQGQRFPLINPQRGIFKPKAMDRLLSIRTVYPRSGARVWYDDQRAAQRHIFDGDDTVQYAFMGQDPDAADNRWLREAWLAAVPIIYFVGVAPGRYHAVVPAFIADWDGAALTARVAFSVGEALDAAPPQTTPERRYGLAVVRRRLHQATFREAVIAAYQGKCAFSGLPETLLLDAAHIVADRDEALGHPVVQNGLPLSKIHHAAFDSHLIGVDPDHRIHVSRRLMVQRDGPMLEALKQLDGRLIQLPRRTRDRPDPERLGLRFRRFREIARQT